MAEVIDGTFGRPSDRTAGSVGLRSDGVTQSRDEVFAGISVEASDPRLSDTASVASSSDSHSTLDGSTFDVFVETYGIVNADGRWSGTLTEFTLPGGSGDTPSSLVLRGEGHFEGLTALLTIDFGGTAQPGGGFSCEGAIIIGDPPPVPSTRSSD